MVNRGCSNHVQHAGFDPFMEQWTGRAALFFVLTLAITAFELWNGDGHACKDATAAVCFSLWMHSASYAYRCSAGMQKGVFYSSPPKTHNPYINRGYLSRQILGFSVTVLY